MSGGVLVIDSATDRPSLALGETERVIPHRHDLSREIDHVARELMAGNSLGGVLVADGPGSFTGLRIGIAFAKGLCRALGIPLYTAPSMLGAALKTGAPLVAVDYDALRGDVYRAVYRRNGGIEVIMAPALVRADDPIPQGARRATADDASALALGRLMGMEHGAVRIADPGSWQPDYGRPAEAEARLKARHAAD